jgi:hypothetical protein
MTPTIEIIAPTMSNKSGTILSNIQPQAIAMMIKTPPLDRLAACQQADTKPCKLIEMHL